MRFLTFYFLSPPISNWAREECLARDGLDYYKTLQDVLSLLKEQPNVLGKEDFCMQMNFIRLCFISN